MPIYFHGNFGVNRPYMAGILSEALENSKMKDAALAKSFGYGAPFAAKYRTWLHKTGIAELSLPLKLTPMGEVIWHQDPNLESLTTQWLMHHELTTNPTRAETWHFFVHKFLPAHPIFDRDDLVKALMELLRSHSEKHFGSGSRMTPVIARKLIECYTEPTALAALGIIVKEENVFRYTTPQTQGPWPDVEELVAAYNSTQYIEGTSEYS